MAYYPFVNIDGSSCDMKHDQRPNGMDLCIYPGSFYSVPAPISTVRQSKGFYYQFLCLMNVTNYHITRLYTELWICLYSE